MTIMPAARPHAEVFDPWFGYCLVIGFFVAYLTFHAVAPARIIEWCFALPGPLRSRLWCGATEQRHLEGADLVGNL